MCGVVITDAYIACGMCHQMIIYIHHVKPFCRLFWFVRRGSNNRLIYGIETPTTYTQPTSNIQQQITRRKAIDTHSCCEIENESGERERSRPEYESDYNMRIMRKHWKYLLWQKIIIKRRIRFHEF